MEEIYREFGRKLSELRKQASLTQDLLGARVEMSRTSIVNIEAGRQRVGLHLLYSLARALGVTPQDLLPDLSEESDEPAVDEWVAKVTADAKESN